MSGCTARNWATMPELLNPLTMPLSGSRLIEASAGTGKTWTIAALVLRLVLGHGRPRPLLPAEILVMTFTKAATRELSERIRQRLVQAAACFRGELLPAPGDDLLAGLLAGFPPDDGVRAAAAWRLAAAAEAMDEAAVHTIDAWCQRMLREHAFDSGCLFDEELQADEAALRDQAVRDYWRQQIYPLSDSALQVALSLWPDVPALLASVRGLLEMPLPDAAGLAAQHSLGQVIDTALAQRQIALQALKAEAASLALAMRDWLDPLWERKDKPIDGTKLGPAHGRRWLQALADWAADPADLPLDLGKGAVKLTPAGVQEALKPAFGLLPAPCFAAFEAWQQALAQLPRPPVLLRLHAAAQVQQRLQALKAQAGSWGFADMLQRLDAALDDSVHGMHGDSARRLRQRIVQQTPVALIDEFQDTSPLQLRIIDRLWRIADDDPALGLLLIGDPKQAIYSFRGADIHSYLSARRATAGRHHVLGTNHRSSAGLVAAVNGCFNAAETRPGAGAFLFRTAGSDDLPFIPVAAQGRSDCFVTAAGAPPAMQLCLHAQLSGIGDSRALFAALCAERIVALLNDDAAGFVRQDKPFQSLRPADIAVLVRTGTEAAAVRLALRQRGVASVYLSDKDSVLASGEARDLLRLLQAIASPRDVRLARAALATGLLACRLPELLALADDDSAFDARCELLAQWHGVWQSQGVLAMLRRALHGLDLPARWLSSVPALPSRDDGERRLTNLLHLAELLQAHSAVLDGEQALIRWLAQQIDDAAAGRGGLAGDEQVLRLESDADLVQVVTVHKSKGLEYPLVFLPFAAHFRARDGRGDATVVLTDADGTQRLLLAPTEAQLAAAERDRLREDLRLLYVGCTRARHALWLGVSLLKAGAHCIWHRSALGALVSGLDERTAQAAAADLLALAAGVPALQIEHPALLDGGPVSAQVPLTRLRQRAIQPALRPALAYSGDFDRLWSISSYSSLVRGIGSALSGLPLLRLLRDDEPAGEEASTAIAQRQAAADQPWHRFPRGALAGNFLHDQLEWLAGEGFALQDDSGLQSALQRRCERQGWGQHAGDVLAWLLAVCSTPLPALGQAPVSLSGLARCLPEMEFWFPSDGLRAQAVDALCCQHILPGRPRPALPERALRGMLMGFADLVFEHGGRYGVLDYKSNALGLRDADYSPAAMEAAMLEHRYDVQAALYLLALHRLLRSRLGAGYRPAQHLQGAVYLFLRGIHSPGGGAWLLAPPFGLIDALDALLGSAVSTA